MNINLRATRIDHASLDCRFRRHHQTFALCLGCSLRFAPHHHGPCRPSSLTAETPLTLSSALRGRTP